MFHVKHSPHILLLNPWITDFAAYNFWIKPLGLLYIASLLRENGFRVTLIDCLDFLVKRRRFGDGNFFKTRIERPYPLKDIPKNYSRYGISEEMLLKRFSFIEENVDLIGITSGMTYWYPGLFKLIEITKKFFKMTPIILGGIYATLCHEHAKQYSGADMVFKSGNEGEAVELISDLTGFRLRTSNSKLRTEELPYPSFDLYSQPNFVCILTTRGCP